MTKACGKVTVLRSVFVTISLVIFATATPAHAQNQCAQLFQETKSRWALIRDRIPGLRQLSPAEEFEKALAKLDRSAGAENVLIGRHTNNRFEILGWANARTLNFESQTVDVEFRGEERTVPMDSVFILGKSRKLDWENFGWRTDETGLRRLYLVTGFSPNGYILGSSIRGRDDSGFDAFPRTQLTPRTKKEWNEARSL